MIHMSNKKVSCVEVAGVTPAVNIKKQEDMKRDGSMRDKRCDIVKTAILEDVSCVTAT